MGMCRQFLQEEEGQDVAEYGLLIATTAVVVLLGTAAFGSSVMTWFTRLPSQITTTGT
jgi:Flp pilus assembly pilin Flp